MQEAVVFVHGIWMKGLEMSLLRRRVQRCGYQCRQFSYHSLDWTPRESAQRLHQFLQQIPAPVIHLVTHSLGGIVVLHLFDQFPEQKPGRIVMLGTPLQGSEVARILDSQSWSSNLLGRAREQGLLGDAPSWHTERELGMIAGNRSIGLGKILTLGRLAKPNDGTVELRSTQAVGIKEHLQVPHSHFGMLFSREVADRVCHFLQTGRFTVT